MMKTYHYHQNGIINHQELANLDFETELYLK